MKIPVFGSMIVALVLFAGGIAFAQGPGWGPGTHGGYGMGPGMMGGYGGYGPGYGMGPGMMGGWDWINIPPKLPAPKNAQWVQRLREIFALEKESLAQYSADQEKFNAHMPYVMVIPQEENHIMWIGQLFAAYGLAADGKVPAIVESKTLVDAYQFSVKLEADLLPRYEWLIKNAEDRDTAQTLNGILIQSRMHLVMFEHSLRMGGGYGFGRGRGMMGGYGMGGYGPGYGMGPGMMGGYGYGRGPRGYRPEPSEACRKFLDETAGMRKDLHSKRYDYYEALRNPGTSPETLAKTEKEMRDLEEKIYSKDPEGCWW